MFRKFLTESELAYFLKRTIGVAHIKMCTIAVAIVTQVWVPLVAASQDQILDQWLMSLQDKQFDGLSIKAKSLQDAWKQLATKLMMPSVFVVETSMLESGNFEFEVTSGSCGDALRKLTELNPNYTWTKDPKTGILWIHSKTRLIESILADKISIEKNITFARMQSDVLERIGKLNPQKYTVKKWGTAFTNTFDYLMDLEAGQYSIQEVLNKCLVQNPTKAFVLAYAANGSCVISATNLVGSEKAELPAKLSLDLWRQSIGSIEGNLPESEALMRALASLDEGTRSAAKAFVEANVFLIDIDSLFSAKQTPVETANVAISLLEILSRSSETTLARPVQKIRELFASSFVEEAPADVVLRSGLQLMRFDPDYAKRMFSRRKFNESDLRTMLAYAKAMSQISYDQQSIEAIRFLFAAVIEKTESEVNSQ